MIPELKTVPRCNYAGKLHSQCTDLLRGKGGSGNIIGLSIQTIFTVEDTFIGHQNLQQRNASAIRRKAVTDPGLRAVPHVLPVALTFHPTGSTGHIIFGCIGQDLQLLHDGQFPVLYKIFHIITAFYRKFPESERLFLCIFKLAHMFDFASGYFSEKRLAKSCISQLNNIGIFCNTRRPAAE